MKYSFINNENHEIDATNEIAHLVELLYSANVTLIDDDKKQLIQKKISEYHEKVPLYDVMSNHIYLIYWENVYPNIFYEKYRFIDNNFLQQLKQKKNPTHDDLENLRVMENYDLEVLYVTYMHIFYESFVINSYITSCVRPSFSSGLTHIEPYYTMQELNYLALDWGLITRDEIKSSIDKKSILNLCEKIVKYDIPSQTLIDHQIYIYKKSAIGMVKYYSLYGSYYMNRYLRLINCCTNTVCKNKIRNLHIEREITIMTKIITTAPKFLKDHVVYRFVDRDEYLQHLKPGDEYEDCSFMSTTRNPFNYKENYAFGYILIKIKIPKNIDGIGLCIESYSNFPSEQEIILPPTSKYKLDSVISTDINTKYHETFDLAVKKKYEFTWIGNNYISKNHLMPQIIITEDGILPKVELIDLRTICKTITSQNLTIVDRLSYFKSQFTNDNNQFQSMIAETTYTFIMESYDSSKVYKKFFYYENRDGIMITTTNPRYGNINMIMEIGPEIHINYYFRFSVSDPSVVVDLNKHEWIEWLSMFAYIVGSRTVVIHSNYMLHIDETDDLERQIYKTRSPFSQDIYEYMKYGKKKFDFSEIITGFEYYQFDILRSINPYDHIKIHDKSELYKILKTSNINNMYDFYLFVVEKYPKLVDAISEKIGFIYDDPDKNPFINIEYRLDAWRYLYNVDVIKYIPNESEFVIKKGSFAKLIGDKKIPKFKNRLRNFKFYHGENKN